MKTKHYILLSLAGLTVFFAGFFLGKDRKEKPSGTETETRETTVDTILLRAPMPQSELALGTHRYTLPVYRFLDGSYGGELRQPGDNDSAFADSIMSAPDGSRSGGTPLCSNDSAIVELPIIQRHYVDSTYEAWVSGPVDPRLDSVRVFVPTTIITKQEWKPPKRWHLGVSAGYGYGAQGFQPYIGVGVTYSIFSF